MQSCSKYKFSELLAKTIEHAIEPTSCGGCSILRCIVSVKIYATKYITLLECNYVNAVSVRILRCPEKFTNSNTHRPVEFLEKSIRLQCN